MVLAPGILMEAAVAAVHALQDILPEDIVTGIRPAIVEAIPVVDQAAAGLQDLTPDLDLVAAHALPVDIAEDLPLPEVVQDTPQDQDQDLVLQDQEATEAAADLLQAAVLQEAEVVALLPEVLQAEAAEATKPKEYIQWGQHIFH